MWAGVMVAGPDLLTGGLAGLGAVSGLAWDDGAALFGLADTSCRWVTQVPTRVGCMVDMSPRHAVKWLAEARGRQIALPTREKLRRREGQRGTGEVYNPLYSTAYLFT